MLKREKWAEREDWGRGEVAVNVSYTQRQGNANIQLQTFVYLWRGLILFTLIIMEGSANTMLIC